jgi:hypothetical protein
MPPSYVKAYVKRSKNDANDAAAICEAVTRPSMRFVATKSEQQRSGDRAPPARPRPRRLVKPASLLQRLRQRLDQGRDLAGCIHAASMTRHAASTCRRVTNCFRPAESANDDFAQNPRALLTPGGRQAISGVASVSFVRRCALKGSAERM